MAKKLGLTKLHLSTLSMELLNICEMVPTSNQTQVSIIQIMCEIKIKVDKKLATGINREFYHIGLSPAQYTALSIFRKWAVNYASVDFDNALLRLMTINNG